MSSEAQTGTISTQVPSRLDRLPWSRFHWRVVVGLGTVWLLDGLEVTMVGSVAARLTESGSGIGMTPGQIGIAAAIYIVGACLGALFFGQLTDRFGRKKLFILTLIVYIAATVATAFSFSPWFFYLARFVTGAGIGGEYAAINSAIDELIPARARGRVDLIINGTYWLGAAGGAAMALFFLNEGFFPTDLGWRFAFGFGAVIGLAILLVRRNVPESPRWLFIHGREQDAEQIVDRIERQVVDETGERLPEPDSSLTVRQRRSIPFRTIAHTAFTLYPKRAVLGLALFVGQAFAYNGITFNLGTLFSTFYDVPSGAVPMFIIIWALGNFAGPVVLGRLFDTVGRKPMISGCYLGAAVLTIPLIMVFVAGTGGQWGFLGILVAVFFLTSAGASAAYLTVSEIFPMETRALAIAFFYAIGTAAGGIVGPVLFGQLVGTGDRGYMAVAFVISAVVLAVGGGTELFLGVKAERENLERIAMPLTAEEPATGQPGEAAAGHPDGTGQHAREAQRHRQEAAQLRARAAEHRAGALEPAVEEATRPTGPATALSAPQGERDDRSASERTQTEQALADVTDLRAQALDERAAAHDEREATGRTDDQYRRAAAQSRAEAAEQRAHALEEQAQARSAAHEAEAAAASARAEAAGEQARAREQQALAQDALAVAGEESGATADLARARATMHEQWSRVHEAQAGLHLARAGQHDQQVAHHEHELAGARQRALAAEQRIAAAEQRVRAAELQPEPDGPGAPAGDTGADRRDADLERRIRERISRRQRRESAGLRRLRPGPGGLLQAGRSGGWEPAVASRAEAALDQEIGVVARALDEHGPLDRHELARLVGARYWGPGRFGAALRAAIDEGRARRISRGTYGPAAPDAG